MSRDSSVDGVEVYTSLPVEWPPRSLSRAHSLARVRKSLVEDRSLVLVRQRAAIIEATQFGHDLENLIKKLNQPSRRESSIEFEEEFLRIEITALPGYYQRSWFETALEPRNFALNRYVNTLAMDSTRVKLQDVEENASDYINASFVSGVPTEISYIAAQNPLPASFGHFWQMIWEQSSSVIIMLTRLEERGKIKGEQYWPEIGQFHVYGGRYIVAAFGNTRKKSNGLIIRHFYLSKIENEDDERRDRLEFVRTYGRLITQIQYIKWPDHDVPRDGRGKEDARALLNLLAMVDELICPEGATHQEPPPVVVHCSAGIGRTGAYIAIDVALRRFFALHNKSPMETDRLKRLGIEPMTVHGMAQLVKRLKQERFGMVQTWQQYRFTYLAFLFGIRMLIEKEQNEIKTLEEQLQPRVVREKLGKRIGHVGRTNDDDDLDDLLSEFPDFDDTKSDPLNSAVASTRIIFEPA